jgi:hypothetical protein
MLILRSRSLASFIPAGNFSARPEWNTTCEQPRKHLICRHLPLEEFFAAHDGTVGALPAPYVLHRSA